MLIPLIRAAATIGFAIAPFSLGFVIIAVSEHLIRSIMVGDDPEMLMSNLQNQFPNDAFEIIGGDDAELVARVVGSIERPDAVFKLPVDLICSNGMQETETSMSGIEGNVVVAEQKNLLNQCVMKSYPKISREKRGLPTGTFRS